VLRISFNGSDERLIAALRSKPGAIFRVLTTKLSALMFQLQAKIVTEKLSGQFLNRQRGKLAGSVRALPTVQEGSKIIGGIEGGGSTAFYGKFYELESAGGTPYRGTAWTIMATKARALRFVVGNKVAFAKSVTHPPGVVKPFMSSTMTENEEMIRAELQAALEGELEKP
jgi:hypothetical protein